jgi:molecular chaperone GrpE
LTNSHADHDQQQTTADEASSEPDLAADGDNPAAVASEENRSKEASGEATENASEEAGEDAAPQTEADALRTELEEALAEQEETNNRLLRTAAELQNVRRRAAKEQRRRATQAKAAALRPMLEVLDDLQRALAAAEDAEEEEDGGSGDTLYDGVQMVEDKFERALAGLGVEPIAAEGHPFDENKHEAMMQQPAPEGTDPGTVLAEIRRGYRMETDADDEDEGERVLRHSRVVVATEPDPPAEEESNNADESADE